MIAIVPVSATAGSGPLYPALSAGNGLLKPSYALVDQIRSIDKRRIDDVYGDILETELDAIDDALAFYLCL